MVVGEPWPRWAAFVETERCGRLRSRSLIRNYSCDDETSQKDDDDDGDLLLQGEAPSRIMEAYDACMAIEPLSCLLFAGEARCLARLEPATAC